MKVFVILLIMISSLGLTIQQTFGEYVEFDDNDYRFFLNNKHVIDFQLNWTSEDYPNGKIAFDESINDTILLQIPKNIPRNTNLDFGSSLYAIQTDGSWEEIKETDSNCFYILEIPVNDSDYIEIETVSVATGRWELVTIQNEDCDDAYDKSTFQNESVFPRHGNPPDSFTPLQHERIGIPLNQIQCRNDDHVLIQRYDGSVACVSEQTKQKLIERGWTKSVDVDNWKNYITVSATRYDSADLAEFLPVYKIKGMSDDKVVNQLLVGADGCKNETEVCKIPSGVSMSRQYSFLPSSIHFSDNDQFSVSLDVQQAEYLLSVMDWKNVGDSFFNTVQLNEKQYFLVLSTFDNVRTPVVKMNLIDTSYEPVSLERGVVLEYPIRVETWATYGAPAQIDLFAVQSAKDSGIKVWVEPETLIVSERNNATSTLVIHALDDAKDGIYDIRVIGKANGNNAGLYCSNTACPAVNIGDSNWSIHTYGSNTGRGIGGGSNPEDTWMDLVLNQTEYFENDVAEIKAYLVNNGTETIQFTPQELLITVIKTQPIGYYDQLYGISARYESNETIVLEPQSKTLLVRPFYWDQTTFKNFDDAQRLDSRQYKMMATFVGENYTWKSGAEFEIK